MSTQTTHGPPGVFEDGQDINAGSLVVTGGLTVSNGTITFPDGTTQTTASGASVKSGNVNFNEDAEILTIGNLSFAYTPSLKTITLTQIVPADSYHISGMLVDFAFDTTNPPQLVGKDVKYFQKTTLDPSTSPSSPPTPVFEISREESNDGIYSGDFKFLGSSYYTYEFFITNMGQGIGQGVPSGQLETYSIKGNVDGYEQISMQCIFQKM